jgi:hypothetical protein
MRSRIPYEAINETDAGFIASLGPIHDNSADFNVFSKHWNQQENADAIIASESTTVFDVCDDHFDRSHGDYYKFMCDQADIIICNTDRMQERIYDVTGKLAPIVPDPTTFNEQEFEYTEEPRFIWYGSRVNIFSIYPWMNKVPNLTMITDAEVPTLPRHVNLIPWEVGVVEEEIANHDIVLLPRNNQPWAQTKSPNRATDALLAGKFVISDFEECFGELEDYIFLGDIETGLDFYRNREYTIKRMVDLGQAYVQEKHSPEAIAQAWITQLTLKD